MRLTVLVLLGFTLSYAFVPSIKAALAHGLGLALMLPIARRSALAIRPPRFPWAAVPLAHLPIAVMYAAGHTVVAFAVRKLSGLPNPLDTPNALTNAVRLGIVFYAVAVVTLLIRPRGQA